MVGVVYQYNDYTAQNCFGFSLCIVSVHVFSAFFHTVLFFSQQYSPVACYSTLVSSVFWNGNGEGKEHSLFFWINYRVRHHVPGLRCVAFSVLLPPTPHSSDPSICSCPSLRMKLFSLFPFPAEMSFYQFPKCEIVSHSSASTMGILFHTWDEGEESSGVSRLSCMTAVLLSYFFTTMKTFLRLFWYFLWAPYGFMEKEPARRYGLH